MSRSEWLRTFVAVYRTGSVTVGARSRGLSQPAASQQLSALAKAVGGPLLVRTPSGVAPTQRGRELYADVAEPLDRLEGVFAGLDGGRVQRLSRPVRIGAAADLFEARILPRLAGAQTGFTAHFADDAALLTMVLAGELDVAVTLATAGRRAALESRPAGERDFVLVSSPGEAPQRPLRTIGVLGRWLAGRPWVSYSRELPVTRRFWSGPLGRSFDARLRLVAPDLRAVVAAVELGMGSSLLPRYVCERGLADGRLVEIYDVRTLVPAEPWFATSRRADAAAPGLADVLDRVAASAGASA